MTNYYSEKWTAGELKILSDLYPIYLEKKLENILCRHTPAAIYQKAFVLGLKKIKKPIAV